MSAATGERAHTQAGRLQADSRWDRLRYALVLGWVAVAVALPFVGERVSSWSEVQTLVATGQVDSVRVSGELPASATGYGLVTVHWRDGLLRYTAEVTEVRGRGQGQGESFGEGTPRIHVAPSTRLLALAPDLVVARDQDSPGGGRLFGWQVPNALGAITLFLFLVAFGLLVSGPSPWRATRWAWFWLLVPPVGGIAFLLLSGPTPGIPAPRRPARRLTGGWAFLLAIPLAAVLTPYRW